MQRVSSVEIADQQVRDAVTEHMSERAGVLDLCRKIANALTNVNFARFTRERNCSKMNIIYGTTNRNRNQNKAEFLSKAMEQLFRNNELLIVESYDGQLLVADDFSVTKNALYGDTYIPMCRWMITHFRGHSEVQTCFTGHSTTRM